ncbi:hypothetical protein L9F63_006731, partial [Diploptera punctata]
FFDEGLKMEELALNEIECPVCYENMTSPIILCIRGHNICGSCSNKLYNTCPICKGAFNSRNLALEEVATKIDTLRKNILQNQQSVSPFDILDRYKTKNTIAQEVGRIIANELKCKLCNKYSYQPIYFCTNGHSTCQKCEICTKCCEKKTDGRNYALERISKQLEYPCPYKEFGCSFILTMEQTAHETVCEFKPLRCPIRDYETTHCSWYGPCEEFKNHLAHSHVSCQLYEVPNFVLHLKYNSNAVIFALGNIFVISILIKTSSVFYKMNVVGSKRNVIKYRCVHVVVLDGDVVTTVVMSPSPDWCEFVGGIFLDLINYEVALVVSIAEA